MYFNTRDATVCEFCYHFFVFNFKGKGSSVKIKKLLVASALSTALVAPASFAADSFTDAQKQDFQKMVHDYIVNNPEVLVEASQALQQKQQQNMQEQAKSAIAENANQLFVGNTTSVGNPKGDVTLVEFFDYQCGHCKKMKPVMSELVKNDKNLRVLYMEFPIFGKSSELASRAALAASMQGKYQQMHNALFDIDSRLDEKLIMGAASSIGLNVEKLKTDMNSKEVSNMLDVNRKLAEKLRLMGTPAFIVASTPKGVFKAGSTPAFVPGAASQQALQDLIKKASAS